MTEVTDKLGYAFIIEKKTFMKIGPPGAHYYFCFNVSLKIESDLEYQYTPV